MKERTPYNMFGPECGPGWKHLYMPIVEAKNDLGVEIFQIKEKFGELRIYLGPAPNWLLDMCEIIERLSSYTCEECGRPGQKRTYNGWVKTICEDCHGKSEAE